MGPKSTYSPTALGRRQRQAAFCVCVYFSVSARLVRCDLCVCACVRQGIGLIWRVYGVYGVCMEQTGIGLARLKTARSHAEMSEWVGREVMGLLFRRRAVVMDVSKEASVHLRSEVGICGSKVL